MVITEQVMHEIKASLESGVLFGITITGDFENLLQSNPKYASPKSVEGNDYQYDDFTIERYENMIFSIRIPAANDFLCEKMTEIMGDGELQSYGNRNIYQYRTRQILAVFSYNSESNELHDITVVTTLFLD